MTETKKIEMGRSLGLAGELHRLIARCLDAVSYQVDFPEAPATPAAAEAMDSWFMAGPRSGSVPAIRVAEFSCPEIFEPLAETIKKEALAAKSALADLTGAEARARERLNLVQSQKHPLSARLPEAEEKLAELNARHADETAVYQRKVREHRPNLAALEDRVAELVGYLKSIPAVEPGRAGHDAVLAAENVRDKQRRLNGLRARLAAARADIARGQAVMDGRAAHVARERLELEKLVIKQRELARYESSIRTSLEHLSQKGAEEKQKLNRLRQAGQDLKQGQRIWRQLEALIGSWPEAVPCPGHLLNEVQAEWEPYRAKLEAAASGLNESRSVIREMDQKFEELVFQVEGLIDRNTEYEAKVSRFSRQVDERTADLKRGPLDARKQIEKTAATIKAVYEERSLLLRRQEFLADRLTRLSEIRKNAVQQAQARQHIHQALQERAVAAVRVRAVQRGALIRRTKRLKDQLLQAYSGLLPLIGRSRAMDTALQAAGTRLEGVGQDLDQLKINLAGAHDAFIEAQNRLDAHPPDPASSPESILKKLQSLDLGGQAVARLPRQLSSYRAALIRHHQIKNLEQADARQELTLERLKAKNGRLLQVLAENKDRLADLFQEKNRLISELSGTGAQISNLAGHVKDDLYPLLNALGLALYRSQASGSEIEKRRGEAENRAAELASLAERLENKRKLAVAKGLRQGESIRLLNQEKRRVEQSLMALRRDYFAMENERDQAVGAFLNFGMAITLESTVRDRQYQEDKDNLAKQLGAAQGNIRELDARIREMEANHQIETAAHKKRIGDLNVKAAQLESGKQTAEAKALELSQSLSELEAEATDRQIRFQIERNKLFSLGKAWKTKAEKLQGHLSDLENRLNHSRDVVQRQGRAIRVQKAQEAEMMALLAFFMEQVNLWANPARETPAAALPEGAEVLALLIHILHQENESLNETVQVLKDDRRLLTLENEHLAKSQGAMKDRLTQLLPVFDFFFRSWFSTTATLAAHHTDRMRAMEELNRIKHQARVQGARLLKLSSRLQSAENDLEQARDRILRLDDEKAEALRLEAEFRSLYDQTQVEVDSLTKLRAKMAITITRQRSELADLSETKATLLLENQTLDRERKVWRTKSVTLSQQALSLSKDLDDRKGQVESAWAAVTLLGTRSKEALAGLQSELTAQAETIHALEMRLDDKSQQIRALEQTQDRLGLLFWMLYQSGGRNEQLAEALAELSGEENFRNASATAGNRLKALTFTALKNLQDARFQNAAKKAARRGFYSLVLACGMVMAAPQDSSRATVASSTLTPGPIAAGLIQSPPRRLADAARGPVYSPYLDRECDISFINPWERSKGNGHIQQLICSQVDHLAHKTGLDRGRFVQLVQRFFEPGQIVSVDHLKETGQTFEMLKNHFPSVSKDFNHQAPQRPDVTELVRLAGLVNLLECRVWDRLYQDYRDLGAGPQKALAMLLGNSRLALENRNQPRPVEFAGKLSPIPEMEKLDLEDFMKVVTPYIKAHIKAIVARPAYAHAHRPEEIDEYARRLACDMYVAGKTFGVPRTMMVAIAHQETYFANILGDHSLSASPFQIYQPTKPYIIRTMAQKGLMVPAVPDHLQNHITLATYMAAFFMSSLIDRHSHQWQKDRPPICDLDRVARSYNGGRAYPGEVYKKKIALLGYLQRYQDATLKKANAEPRG